MRRRILSLCVILTTCLLSSYAQVTYSPKVRSQNNDCTIEKVELTNSETIVTIKVPRSKRLGGWVRFSSATVMVPSEEWNIAYMRQNKAEYPPASMADLGEIYREAVRITTEKRKLFSDRGYLIRSLGNDMLDARYKITEKGREFYYFELHFDRLPMGVTDFYIRELMDGGYEWAGIQISNPVPEHLRTGLREWELKPKINACNDGITGIYEGVDDNKYKLACIKDGDTYKFIYLGANEDKFNWQVGDVKAILKPTSSSRLFKADWYMLRKDLNSDVFVGFEGNSMEVIFDDEKDTYIKMYPTSAPTVSQSQEPKSSGTGFFLTKDGYIVTNHHVVEDAKTLKVTGVNGDHTRSYNARVEITDKQNDLAIIKIDDATFRGLASVPYAIKTSTANVGENCFVLGYPLISTMGLDIKLTNGIISSKTGFQGNVAEYQISAPVQPGNSGGPLFDKDGNVIGVVCAKHLGAENAGYAVKASYLRNLVELLPTTIALPANNLLKGKTLPQQVESASKAVCVIIVNGDISDVQ